MNILDKIIKAKAARLVDLKKSVSPADMEAKARSMPAPERNFLAALTAPKASSTGGTGIHVIAEVKKASPSRGVIRADFKPLEIAKAYLEGGASALSILTEEDHFQGHDRYLRDISRNVGLPTLRKDFIVDDYQIHEAKVLGASAYLLIVACLKPKQLASMIALGAELGLTPLVETHTEDEVKIALDAGSPIIGINNRDLKTFLTSLETTYRLRPLIPDGTPVVSESGIHKRADLEALAAAKVQAALIGESLMKQKDVAAALKDMLAFLKVLFVCLGNICRSPIAEGIFAHLVRELDLQDRYLADSAGTGDWHVGQPPDRRAITAAQERGVALPSLCRQVRKNDFQDFDLILAMDKNNLADLTALCPAPLRSKIKLMREYDIGKDAGADVPDPYYGGPYEFDQVYEMLDRCCSRLLGKLEGGTSAASHEPAPDMASKADGDVPAP